MSHLLIVEDEDIIRGALRRLLERNGYEVSEAHSVQDAVDNHDLDSSTSSSATCACPAHPAPTSSSAPPRPSSS